MKRKNKKQTKRKGKRKREEKRKEKKTRSSTLKGVKCSYIKREILSLEVNTAKLEAF